MIEQQSTKPPIIKIGIIGWIKGNLFSTWYNSLFTLLGLYIFYLAIPPFFQWAIIDAVWTGDDRFVCEWYNEDKVKFRACLLYTSPSPRD